MKNEVWQQIVIFILLVFFSWSYGVADYSTGFAPTYGTEYWNDSIYYIGESLIFTLFCISLFKTSKWELRIAWATMAAFLGLRTVALLIAAICGINPNVKVLSAILFYITAAVILWITFLPIIVSIVSKAYSILKAWHKRK